MKALMIGCGHMGGALLTRWADSPDVQFTVIDPETGFSHDNVTVRRDKGTIETRDFDLAVIAIKPQMIEAVVPGYLELMAKDATIVSIAAGYGSEKLSAVCGGRPVIRIMPNMPASVGKGMSGLYAMSSAPQETITLVNSLMARTGALVQVDAEDDLDKVTAVAGSGPGYVFEIARTYVEAAEALGFDGPTARKLVLETLAGAVEMARQSDAELAELRSAVTSKAGTTEAGLNALNGNDTLTRLMAETIQAAYARAVALR